MSRRRTLLATLVLSFSVSSCSLLGEDGPRPEDAADQLASALATGDLAAVRLDGVPDAQQWWEDSVGELADWKRTVTSTDVKEADSKATARLRYDWRLPTGAHWTYDATAELVKAEDTWSVVPRPSMVVPDLRGGEHLASTQQLPPRADILGQAGESLVTARPVLRIGIDKTKVAGRGAQAGSARALASLLDIDPPGFAEQVRKAGVKAFVEAIVLRKQDVTPAIRAGIESTRGAVGLDDTLPLAPTREFARPILGGVGEVTAEIVEESNGVYHAGDEAGLSGLQQRYDERLRGEPGIAVEAVSSDGASRHLYSVPPEPGDALRLTLDIGLQTEAERLLASVKPASALVAIRPSTGQVLAAASGPGGGGLSTATVGQFAPGSTMKIVTSLALLRAGLGPGSPMSCPLTVVVDGKAFKNYADYPPSQLGRIDLARAVANSCNTAFIGRRDKVAQKALAGAAAALGLGVDHDLGYPVFLGSVPGAASSETEHAASLIGQGKVLASPLAMATVAASVGSGRTVVPRLVAGRSADADPAQPLTAAEARKLRSLMRGVVESGSGAFLADVPAPPVLGKTGTAEFGDEVPLQTHAWMVAVHGDLAVAVFVDVGESGSRTAGPILEAFLRSAALMGP